MKALPGTITEREIKQLSKLLRKFKSLKTKEGDKDEFSGREQTILSQAEKWVSWYASDELGIDL